MQNLQPNSSPAQPIVCANCGNNWETTSYIPGDYKFRCCIFQLPKNPKFIPLVIAQLKKVDAAEQKVREVFDGDAVDEEWFKHKDKYYERKYGRALA